MEGLNRFDGISKKYDATLDYGIVMYDNLPYQRDSDVCNESTVALYSGHVIKYYLCKNEQEHFVVNNQDDRIERILQQLRIKAEREVQVDQQEIVSEHSREITQEQIQSLLEDSGEMAAEEDSDQKAAQTETINLDDIEDW